MSIRKLLDTIPLFDLVPLKKDINYQSTCISFDGAPHKHPYDNEKLLLFIKPFSSHTRIYEFRIEDIAHIDELPSIGTDSGENLTIARIWVQKGSLAVQFLPFEVQDPLKFYEDSELLHQVLSQS